MNSRRIILVLTATNLGLLGSIGAMILLLREPPGPAAFVPRGRPVTNLITQIAVRKVNATNLLATLAIRPESWRSLESTNYAEFIANLRGFGCPEETIRDIIITDIAKIYNARRAALRAQSHPFKFWETSDQVEAHTGPGSPLYARLKELDHEQRELVRELLGVEYDSEIARYTTDTGQTAPLYDFLPQDKQGQVRGLVEKYQQMQQEIYDRSRGLMLEQDESQLRKIQRQRDAELAQMLSPEELEDFQLRNSETAQNLRAQLGGFQPSEDEFRKIFRLQKSLDDEMGDAFANLDDDRKSEVWTQAMQDAQQALNDEIKRTLGDKRYSEYARAQDTDFKTLQQFTDRFQMSRDVANRIYDLKTTADKQREQVIANASLSQDQRQAALAALARETERTVASALGEQAFQSYQKAGGFWLRDLGVAPPAPEPPPVEPQPPPPGVYVLPPPIPPPNRPR